MSNIKKKGFSLIEMSMVLLLMGALTMGVSKGRYLLAQTAVTSDLAQINILSTAVHDYVASEGMAPTFPIGGFTPVSTGEITPHFINRGYVALNALKLSSSPNSALVLYSCSTTISGNYQAVLRFEGSICLTVATLVSRDRISTPVAFTQGIACHYEKRFDDSDYSTGVGRGGIFVPSYTVLPPNCATVEGNSAGYFIKLL